MKTFQKAECIYDVTYYFANTFLKVGDRTIDQMVQAARSGKQNLAEGNIDGITSREMELKLTNVNRASLHELLLDYEDYLRVRGLEQWAYNDPRCVQTRAFCKTHLDSAVFREKIKERSDETIANIAITLIHQCDILIYEGHGYNGYNGRYGVNGQNPTRETPSQPTQPIKPNNPNKP